MSFPAIKVLYKRHEEDMSKMYKNVDPFSWPTTNVICPLHECKKVCPWKKALPRNPSQAVAHEIHESSKVGGKGKRE